MPATITKTTKAASERARFASWQRYEKFLATTKSNNNADAAGRISNDRHVHGAAAAIRTETLSMPATKCTRLTTSMSSNTPAQVERRDSIPTERRHEAIGFREGVNCTLFEDYVVDGLLLHEIATKPSYALILKKRRTGARGYALAAAALSSTPAAYKTPTRKQSRPYKY